MERITVLYVPHQVHRTFAMQISRLRGEFEGHDIALGLEDVNYVESGASVTVCGKTSYGDVAVLKALQEYHEVLHEEKKHGKIAKVLNSSYLT
jgi:hypothetical protein